MRLFFLVLIVIISSCRTEPNVGKEPLTPVQRAGQVTIIRDDFGVPHIYGKTDADAVFGLLYAQCEDDFNRVEQNYIWAMGRLAEVEGESALYSDLRAQLFMTRQEAIDQYEQSPQWLKKLCDAFADGINYYLETHPEVKPKLLTHFEPWMPMYFSEGSIGGDIERVDLKKLQAFYEGGMEILDKGQQETQKQVPVAEPQGSNGIAISGKLTASGNTLLLINPHTSFYFRGEVQVVSEQGLNAYGAVTWGQFFVYQGFNEKTGWMHTSGDTDVLDEFKETIVNIDGNLLYQYGGELRPLESSEIVLNYKEGNLIKQKKFTGYRSHHGPITHVQDGQWTATAMMWEPAKALEQAYIRTKQTGYEGFLEMMALRTNSSNSTVYADAAGNIGYFHSNFVPKRDPIFDYSKPVDGSDPKTDWQGLHTVDETIVLKNPTNGWLQNCNSTPFTAAAESSPIKENFPGYMTTDTENFRGVHAIALLKDKKDFTLDGLIALAHDPYLPAFQALIPGLINAYNQFDDKNPKLREAIQLLEKWDYRTSKESVAMTLAHYYGTLYGQLVQKEDDLDDMEAMIYFGSRSPAGERLQVFEKTLDQLTADFGTWKMPWGEVNRYQRINGDIKQPFDDSKPSLPIAFASGRWGALAAYGANYSNGTKKIYGTRGNSFAAVVEFGDKVQAKSILAGGQNGDPGSPHFNDQIQRYANADWKTVAFYKEDVLKRARETYSPGGRK